MSGFDIESLLEFQPARHWCIRCFALWKDDCGDLRVYMKPRSFFQCKSCGLKYFDSKDFPMIDADIYGITKFLDYIDETPLKNVHDIVEHCRKFAMVSKGFREYKNNPPLKEGMQVYREHYYTPLRALMMALNQARSFVHFTSVGLSSQMIIGLLKMTAQNVPVRGIVSGNIGENIISEVDDFKDEAPNLSIKFCGYNGLRPIDSPHQKLVVIDGLLAFKGSANLNHMAWRSASQGKDIIEIVSNIDEIIDLHNHFFSPIWGKMDNSYGGEITMVKQEPPW